MIHGLYTSLTPQWAVIFSGILYFITLWGEIQHFPRDSPEKGRGVENFTAARGGMAIAPKVDTW
jgi:hypothetical protein